MVDLRETGLDAPVQHLRSNLDHQLVEETELKGDEALKAPTVAVTEGVLRYNGGRRELLPADEIRDSLPLWNSTPVTIGHPTAGGRNLSATQPDVFNESVVGLFMNSRFDNSKRALKGDVYLNREWLDAHPRGGEVLEAINNDETLEVSTAYLAPDSEDTEGKHNGQKYNRIQRGLQPNHFAILLDEPGNCSIEDGCGFPRRNSDINAWEVEPDGCCDSCEQGGVCEDVISNVRQTARNISWTGGTETNDDVAWSDVPKDLEGWWEGYTENSDASGGVPDSYADAPDAFKDWQADRSLLGQQTAQTWREANVLPVVNPLSDSLHRQGLISAKAAARGAQGATFSPQQESTSVSQINDLLIDNFDFEADDFEANSEESMEENREHMNKWGIRDARQWLENQNFGEEQNFSIGDNYLTFWFADPQDFNELRTDKEPLEHEMDEGIAFVTGETGGMGERPDVELAAVKFYHGGQVENSEDIDSEEVRSAWQTLKGILPFANEDTSAEADELESNSDTDQEDQMEEDQQETVENAEADEAEADGSESEDVEENEAPEAVEATQDVEQSTEEETFEVTRDELTQIVSDAVDERLENNEAINQVTDTVKKQRKNLEKTITANSSMTEEDVGQMDMEQLRRLRRSVTDSDYSGQAPAANSQEEPETNKAPSPPNVVRSNNREDK